MLQIQSIMYYQRQVCRVCCTQRAKKPATCNSNNNDNNILTSQRIQWNSCVTAVPVKNNEFLRITKTLHRATSNPMRFMWIIFFRQPVQLFSSWSIWFVQSVNRNGSKFPFAFVVYSFSYNKPLGCFFFLDLNLLSILVQLPI